MSNLIENQAGRANLQIYVQNLCIALRLIPLVTVISLLNDSKSLLISNWATEDAILLCTVASKVKYVTKYSD